MPRPPIARGQGRELAQVLYRNIDALVERRHAQAREQTLQDRLADRMARFAGSMAFVWIHAVIVAFWVAANIGWIPFVPPFDSDFVKLATTASVEAIFITTFVLVTQNRMAAAADKRAELDLQISLLAEHEVTRLVRLVAKMAERMGIEESQAPDLAELEQDVRPEAVLDHLERASERPDPGAGASPPAP